MLLKHSGSERGHLMPSVTTRIRLLEINAVLLLCCSRVSAVEIPKDFQQMIVSIEVPSSKLVPVPLLLAACPPKRWSCWCDTSAKPRQVRRAVINVVVGVANNDGQSMACSGSSHGTRECK
jgi:hypothetical protein